MDANMFFTYLGVIYLTKLLFDVIDWIERPAKRRKRRSSRRNNHTY